MPPIRVVIADDHPVVRAGVRNLLCRCAEISVVGETGNGAEVLSLVDKLQPDVLLLDMDMPGMDGVSISRKLRNLHSTVRVLALSAHDDKQYILQLLEQGAAGYLIKDEAPDIIVDAVLGVARGEQGWLSRKVSMRISNWMREADQDPDQLSPREIEILRHLTRGKTNQAIALALGISEKTIEKNLDTIFKKLKVTSRVDAAVFAVRNKLI
jgi:two-component system response regulator DegU